MRPERVAGLVARWVRLYTRNLPAGIAQRRIDEIEADLHDHVAHERTGGTNDSVIARTIASRMLRGLPADVSWRGRQAKLARRSPLEQPMRKSTVHRSALRVALGVALILSLPLLGTLIGDMVWSLADFVLAGVLLTVIGVALELAARKAGNLPAAFALAALGLVAAAAGGSDDAPGLVLLGLLLIASACALGLRSARHSS
jgi:hypothetical protein